MKYLKFGENLVMSLLKVLLYFGIYIACQIVSISGVMLLGFDPMAYTIELSIASAVLSTAVYIVIFVCRKKNFFAEVEIRSIKPIYFALMPIFGGAMNFLMAVILSFISFPEAWVAEYDSVVSTIVGGDTVTTVLFIVLIAPVFEEILFRGLIHTRLRRAIPMFGAMIASSWIFGATHGVMIQLIYASLLGLLLAWIFEKSGSLIASILFHVGFNLCGLAIGYYQGSLLPMLILSVVLSIGSIVYIQRNSERKIEFVRKN